MLASGNVIETDLLVVTGGFMYALTLQRHIADGRIDVGPQNGGWVDTGLRMGKLMAGHPYRVRWECTFGAQKCSALSYQDGIQAKTLPAQFSGMEAKACNWLEGAYIQIQPGSMPVSGLWSLLMDNVRVEWA